MSKPLPQLRAVPPTPGPEREPRHDPAFQHKLEQFNPGMVWLDNDQRITALNDIALQILVPTVQASMGIPPESLIGSNILAVHPPKSREKIEFLLRRNNAPAQTMFSPPPVAMMINIPDRLLMIKVSQMMGADGPAGTCMIFYDLTDATTAPAPHTAGAPEEPRLLSRIPVYRRDRIVLVDVNDIARFESDGHYTNIVTLTDRFLCNFSMAMLEQRLDPKNFLRVHRCHIVSLTHIVALMRQDEGMSVVMPPGCGGPVPVSKNNLARLKARFALT